MSNSEQLAELSSLEAIYEGSREVVLELPDLAKILDEGVSLQATFRAPSIHIKIWLLPGYLSEDGDTALPLFELSSSTCTEDALSLFGQELQSLGESLRGSPVLFSWLEWLRVDARAALSKAARVSREEHLETPSDDDVFDDVPTCDPDELRRSTTCESCAVPLDSVVRVDLKACRHSLCAQCASTASQVFAANKHNPHCPLPSCRVKAPELLEWDGDVELWASVSKRILATPLKDCIVFCPKCEDRGMDMPVVTSLPSGSSGGVSSCKCFRCEHVFCAVCRSPAHSGSCFDNPRCVVRMAKRRPPLTNEMAERAATKAAEIREEELRWESEILDELRAAEDFETFRNSFLDLHYAQIMNGLQVTFGSGVQLREAPVKHAVQARFMANMGTATIKPAWHGTDPNNYPSIFSRGLLIPGNANELRVVHGAAHGRGIYTANVDAPWLSRGFCTSQSMLVCAVRQEMVTHVGDAMVVFNPDNVVPLFEGYVTPGQGGDSATKSLPWKTPLVVQSSAKQIAQARAASKPAQPPPAKPAAKKSKFLTRLAAKSKKH